MQNSIKDLLNDINRLEKYVAGELSLDEEEVINTLLAQHKVLRYIINGIKSSAQHNQSDTKKNPIAIKAKNAFLVKLKKQSKKKPSLPNPAPKILLRTYQQNTSPTTPYNVTKLEPLLVDTPFHVRCKKRAQIKGQLLFGDIKTFNRVSGIFARRKKECKLLAGKNIFKIKTQSFSADFNCLVEEKNDWVSTVTLLEIISSYSIRGELEIHLSDYSGNKLRRRTIRTNGDKNSVELLLAGSKLAKRGISRKDKEKNNKKIKETVSRFNQAIHQCAGNVLIHETRGQLLYLQKKYNEAINDFNECLKIDRFNPDTYWQRGMCYFRAKRWSKTIKDMAATISYSMPHEPIYWNARQLKGECHLKLNQIAQAIYELQLFIEQPFDRDNPNFRRRRIALKNYIKAILPQKNYSEIESALQKLLTMANEELENPIKKHQNKRQKIRRYKTLTERQIGLAAIKKNKGEYKEANDHYLTAIAHGSEDALNMLMNHLLNTETEEQYDIAETHNMLMNQFNRVPKVVSTL